MKIHIPTPLRTYTAGEETVDIPGATIASALENLTSAYPSLKANLYTPDGKLRSFVNLYFNDEDIRYLPAKEATPASDSDELTIIPSIAGGN
ncbi:MAG: MoaD/ThiS family protein [Acidobacteriota bacterium]|nr:MoaD/ThiS family protein [Acidobacteriota bacterium]